MHNITGKLSIASALLALVGGCQTETPTWGSVSGVVRCEGQPVSSALVLFSCRDIGVEMTAQTDAEGRFTLRTDKVDGLPIGNYRVAVLPQATNLPLPAQGMMFTGPAPQPVASPLPAADRHLQTTSLSAVVNEGENHFEFNLKP